MSESNDMEPVTRSVVREVVASELDKRDYVTRDVVKDVVASELDKRDYVTRTEFAAELDKRDYVTRTELTQLETRLFASLVKEMRGLIQGLEESLRREFRVLDDKYTDLPGRVKRLEETVFPPSPRVRRKRRAS